MKPNGFFKRRCGLDPANLGHGNLGNSPRHARSAPPKRKMFRAVLARSAEARLRQRPTLANWHPCGEQGVDEVRNLPQALALSQNEPHVCNGFAWFPPRQPA
jgi:hypothetical protein